MLNKHIRNRLSFLKYKLRRSCLFRGKKNGFPLFILYFLGVAHYHCPYISFIIFRKLSMRETTCFQDFQTDQPAYISGMQSFLRFKSGFLFCCCYILGEKNTSISKICDKNLSKIIFLRVFLPRG